MSYFRPSGLSKNEIKVELDLSNYATKPDLKTSLLNKVPRVLKSPSALSA